MAILVYRKDNPFSDEVLNSLSDKMGFKVSRLDNLKEQNLFSEDIVVLDPENMNDEDYKILGSNNEIMNLWNLEKLRNFLVNPEKELPVSNPRKTVDVVYTSNLEPSKIFEEGIIRLLNTKNCGYVIYLSEDKELSMINKFSLIDNFMGLLSKRFPQLRQLDKISRTIMMSRFFMDNFPNSQVNILENLGRICAELALLRYKVQTGEITLGADGETSLSKITAELERIHEYLDKIFGELFDNMFFTFMSQFISPPQLESSLVEDFLKLFTSMSSKLDAACGRLGLLKVGKHNLKKLLKQFQISHSEKKEIMKNYKSSYKSSSKIFRSHSSVINRSMIDEFAGLVIFLEGLRKTVENQLELMNTFSNIPKIVWGIGELSELIFVDLNFLISKLRKLYQASPTFVQIRGDIVLNTFDGPGGLIEKWGTTVRIFREYNQHYKDDYVKETLASISKILNFFHQKVLEALQYFQRDITIMNMTEYAIQTSELISRITPQKDGMTRQELRRLYKEFTFYIIAIFKRLTELIANNREISNRKNAQILAAWEYIKQKIRVSSKKERRKKLIRTVGTLLLILLVAVFVYLLAGDYLISKLKDLLINLKDSFIGLF